MNANSFYLRLSAFICGSKFLRIPLASVGVLGGSIFFCFATTVSHAALPIDIEVAAESGAPFGAMQDWGKLLNGMDLYRVRLRSANGGDEPSVKATGEGESQRFKLVGILNRRDQLVLPGGTFAATDRARLLAYFESLPQKTAEQGIERGIFGLTKQQFESLYEELTPPVTISTKGMKPEAIVTALRAGLSTPLEIDATAQAALSAAPPLIGELKGLSTGTALAIAIRPASLTMFPEQRAGQPLTLHVIPASRERRGWPAGWKPGKADREILPDIYRFTNIEITGYTLAEALEALGPAMGVPLLIDERVLAVRKIDPTKIDVELKHGKRYIRRAVDIILSKGRLVGDLRVDEAEKPFYWITQFGPDSLPAAAK